MFATYLRLRVSIHASGGAVVRAAAARVTPQVRRDPRFREARKKFYRAMLRHHAACQDLAARHRL